VHAVPAGPAHQPTAASRRRARASPAEVGRIGEELAAQHLERRGTRVLARNVRTRAGEIDIVAFDGRALIFVEVKTLQLRRAFSVRPRQSPDPLAGLHPRQRARLRRLAAAWLSQTRGARPYAETIRFDAVGVLLDARSRLLYLEQLEAAW
jgi:putative endonuclease